MDDRRTPRWVLILWSLQCIPSVALFVLARLSLDNAVLSRWKAWTVIGVAISWTLVVVTVAVVPKARARLATHRWQLLLAFTSIAVTIVLVDAGLTAMGVVPTMAAQRGRSLSYALDRFPALRLVPQQVENDKGVIHINRRGLRGPEIAEKEAPEIARILVLGGSQVFDWVGNWPEKLETTLRDRALPMDVNVLNAGAPGHTTNDSVEKLVSDLWTLSPAVIVLCQAWNDTKYLHRVSETEPVRGLPPEAPKPWFPDWRIHPSGLDRLLTSSALYRNFRWAWARRLYPEEGLASLRASSQDQGSVNEMGLSQFRLNLSVIASIAESIGAKLVLCKQARLFTADGSGDRQSSARDYATRNTGLTPDALVRAFDACHRVIEEVAASANAVVVDMDHEMTGRGNYFVDGIHFSEAGGTMAAELVASAIAPLLTAERDPLPRPESTPSPKEHP